MAQRVVDFGSEGGVLGWFWWWRGEGSWGKGQGGKEEGREGGDRCREKGGERG